MLVITRKRGESIHIGNEIELTLLDVREGRARIGIVCPREIPVLRHELIGLKQNTREMPSGKSQSAINPSEISKQLTTDSTEFDSP